jgi:hypothetical protein
MGLPQQPIYTSSSDTNANTCASSYPSTATAATASPSALQEQALPGRQEACASNHGLPTGTSVQSLDVAATWRGQGMGGLCACRSSSRYASFRLHGFVLQGVHRSVSPRWRRSNGDTQRQTSDADNKTLLFLSGREKRFHEVASTAERIKVSPMLAAAEIGLRVDGSWRQNRLRD